MEERAADEAIPVSFHGSDHNPLGSLDHMLLMAEVDTIHGAIDLTQHGTVNDGACLIAKSSHHGVILKGFQSVQSASDEATHGNAIGGGL